MQGAPVCILHTVGRKSGQKRESPLFYLADGDDVILVASARRPRGAPRLVAEPQGDGQPPRSRSTGKRTRMSPPRRATAEEKAAYWPKLNAMYEHYEAYQERTSRDIPVIVMTPTTLR